MSNVIDFLGFGTVANNKESNTHQIYVYLPKVMPLADGKTTAEAKESQQQSKNAKGEAVQSTVMQGNAIPCVWNPMGDSNRLTPPDVREGSKVSVYQVTGSDTYYWTTWGINAETMRLETVMYGWSANPNIDENAEFNIDNFYTFSVSTHTGEIRFRTSQANGEATVFEMLINAMKGKIMIGGKEKNYMVFDDIKHSLTYTNAEGSVIDVTQKVITAYSKDSINMQGVESINLLTKTLNIECKDWRVKADTTQFNISKSWQIKCPETSWEGNITLKGNIDQDGGINSTGKIHSDTDVTSKVSLNNHLTTGVKSGSDQSGGPV